MGESSSGDLSRRLCLSIILKRCVGPDERSIKELAGTLRNEEVVGKELEDKWIDLVQRNQTERALDEMLDCIIESQPGVVKLPYYLHSAKVPETITGLVSTIVGKEEPPKIVVTLIQKWYALVQHEENIKQEIPQIFPENQRELLENWPLNFISFCGKQTELQRLQEILTSIGVAEPTKVQLPETAYQTSLSQTLTSGESGGTEPQGEQDFATDNTASGSTSLEGTYDVINIDEFSETHTSKPRGHEDMSQPMEVDPYRRAEEYRPAQYQDNPMKEPLPGVIQVQPKPMHPNDAGQTAYKFQRYQSGGSVSHQQHDAATEFFIKHREEIRASRLILSPVVELAWPKNKKLTKEDAWPKELIDAVSTSYDSLLIRSLTIVFNWLLDKEKVSPGLGPAAKMEGTKLDGWISTNLPTIIENKEKFEIFRALFAIAWPGMGMSHPGSWVAFLIKGDEAHEGHEVATFISVVQMMLGGPSKSKDLQSVPSTKVPRKEDESKSHEDHGEFEVYDQGASDYFSENYSELFSSREILIPVVELAWPTNEKLIEQRNWPAEVMQAIYNRDDELFVRNLGCIFKRLLDIKKASPEIGPAIKLDALQSRNWISNSLTRFTETKRGAEIFRMLLAIAWPDMGTTQPKLWKEIMLTKCENATNQVATFLSIVQILAMEQFTVATGRQQISDEETTATTRVADDAKEYFDKNISKIAESRDLLLPIVGIIWSGKKELTQEKSWPAQLRAIIHEADSPALAKRFAALCEWFWGLKSQGTPDYTIKALMTTEEAREWMLLCPAELQNTQRNEVFKYLLAMTWPEDEGGNTNFDDWGKFLLRKFKEDADKATNFANAVVLALQLHEASKKFKDAQDLYIHELTGDAKLLNENYDDIASSLDTLTPFVKLIWPEDAELLDEKYWPADLLVKLVDSKNKDACQNFAEICSHVIPLKKVADDIHPIGSFSSHEARGWLMRAEPKLGICEEGISMFKIIYQIVWPGTEIPMKEDWTSYLLRNHRNDEARATDFANAANVVCDLMKTSHQADGCKSDEWDTRADIFNDIFEEMRTARSILLPIVVLLWQEGDKVTDEKTWPEELTAKALAAREPKNGTLLAKVFREVIEMRKGLLHYDPETLDSLQPTMWIMKGVGELERSHKDLFYKLLEITWPGFDIGSGAIAFLFNELKADKDKLTRFAKAGATVQGLIKATHQIITPEVKGPNAGDTARMPVKDHKVQVKAIQQQPSKSPPGAHGSSMQTRSTTSGPDLVMAENLIVKEQEIQPLPNIHSPVCRVEVPPDTAVLLKIKQGDGPGNFDREAGSVVSYHRHEGLRPRNNREDAMVTEESKALTRADLVNIRSDQYQNKGREIVIRSVVEGVSKGDTVCIIHGNSTTNLCPLSLSNDTYTATLRQSSSAATARNYQFVYRYRLISFGTGQHRDEENARIIESDCKRYIFDVVSFSSRQKSFQEQWGEKMIKHLPLRDDKLFNSPLLEHEISQWLRQMIIGWGTTEKKISVKPQTTDKVILAWLRKLHRKEKVMGAIALLLATDKQDHEVSEEVKQELSILFNIYSMTIDEKDQLYRHIRNTFVTETQDPCTIAQTVLDKIKKLKEPIWLLSLSLVSLLNAKSAEISSKDWRMRNKLPFLLAKARLVQEIAGGWNDGTKKQKKNKDFQTGLISLIPDIQEMYKTYPWIALIYQDLLKAETTCRLVVNENPVIAGFELNGLLKDVLSDLDSLGSKYGQAKGGKILKPATQHFKNTFSRCSSSDFIREFTDDEMTSTMDSMHGMMTLIVVYLKKVGSQNEEHIFFCQTISAFISNWALTVCSQRKEYTSDRTMELLRAILQCVIDKMKECDISHKQGIMFCNKLIMCTWHEEVQSEWITMIQNAVNSRIDEVWDKEENYFGFYVNKIVTKEINKDLEDCFEDKAIKCAEVFLSEEKDRGKNYQQLRLIFSPSSKVKMSFFEKLFLKSCKKYGISPHIKPDIKTVLTWVCEWTIASEFLKKFKNNDCLRRLQRAKDIIIKLGEVFREFGQRLTNKQVCLEGELNVITRNRDKACQVLQLFCEETTGSTSMGFERIVASLIEKRDLFYQERNRFKMLYHMCKERGDIETTDCKKIVDLYDHASKSNRFKEIFTSTDIAKEPGRFYGVTKHDFDKLALMESVKDSKVLENFWIEVFNEYKDMSAPSEETHLIDWKIVLRDIWDAVRRKLCTLVEEMVRGSIKVHEVIRRFSFTNGEQEKIRKEYEVLCRFYNEVGGVDLTGTKECQRLPPIAKQIRDVFKMKERTKGLKWVLDYKQKFQLRGDFTELEQTVNIEEDKVLTLHDINDETMRSLPEKLQPITPGNLEVLHQFLHQNNLISWLQSKKISDLDEVKTMCDLAIASAGEAPIETDRWKCLLAAAQGFEPLLFKSHKINSTDELLERCEEVFKNVDSNIVKKWHDCGNQLKWFSEKESLHGSHQKRSLKYAQSINERGVYTVGNQTERRPTLENSISLTLQEENSPRKSGESRREREVFGLHMLQDLQLKLALIAGKDDKGQHDIPQFVDVFTAVKTLGESFINLLDAGCMLFHDWAAVIASAPCRTADRQNELNLTLTMRFTKNGKPLTGAASLSMLNDLSKKLRNAYHQWTKYIGNKCLHHYYLNEYNMQQVTYLCHQLATIQNMALLPDQVLALLFKDSVNSAPGKLEEALDRAIRIDDQQETQGSNEGAQSWNENGQLSERKKKNRIIRMLVDKENLGEDLAKAAVQAAGHENFDDCCNWALLHQFDEEMMRKNLQEYNEENAYAHERNEEEELVDVLHNRAVKSLSGMIDQILESTQDGGSPMLVGAIKTICARYYERTSVLTMQDYLSVDHLGKFLTNLHAAENTNPVVHRSLSEPLEQGKPNLIVCSGDESLTAALSLYMHNPEQPLPTTSEVLLCSEKTTVDDVERFMRRAMCKCEHNGEPIFCMAFSEKLNFKVSQALERFFETLSHQDQYIDQKYQMIIISSNPQHYITECFDKYQVPRWPKNNRNKMHDYLKQHLDSGMETDSEFNSSIIKVVASNRSGVGKSLYIRRLSDQLDKRWYEDCQIEHMAALVEVLGRTTTDDDLPGRPMPTALMGGKPNLIHCSGSEILPALLTMYMQEQNKALPTSAEVLLSCQQTSEEEIERFMRRAMCKLDKDKSLFTIAYANRLTPEAAKRVRDLSDTLSRNMHCRKDYQLVIISSHLTPFSWCEKFEIMDDSAHSDPPEIAAYLAGKKIKEQSELKLQNLEQGHEHVEQSQTENENTPARIGQVHPWYKTTVRLLEKSIDNNHVIGRLCKENHIRNDDHHFIHIDLTPAVEDGIEIFMFNLLILGTIQDDGGKVWNRNKKHLYVVEITESLLNQTQILDNSILNMLPRILCKSPKESFEKLKIIRTKTKEVLKAFMPEPDRAASNGIVALMDYIEDRTQFQIETYRYQESSFDQMSNPLWRLLYLAGIPPWIIASVNQAIPESARKAILQIYYQEDLPTMVLMDYQEFISTNFQRPYQYLKYSISGRTNESITKRELNLDDFQYIQPAGTPEDCIDALLQSSAVGKNPSWAQLRHFASFLNLQLQNCEESQFCQKVNAARNKKGKRASIWEDTQLKGLKAFAVKFMMRMSQDFATPSLDIADQSEKDADAEMIETHRVRRKWEGKCHPYVFFNEDRATMSFINVHLNSRGDLLDEDGAVLESKIASKQLVRELKGQEIKFGFNFHLLTRTEKLNVLRTVMGLPYSVDDPDPTYELTTDNALKILAIYMRMRCKIPVILMGETGCGKTRLVEFMSKLRGSKGLRNMVTLKIHGGVNTDDIYDSVTKANQLAEDNSCKNVDTVLFYDEANTTNAIYAIKEVMCDGTVNGKPFQGSHLQIVAACNPYKQLSERAIKTLEKSGLGYRVSTSETSKSLGIPMRRLIYKVVALPPSVQPFVWDFGELSVQTEEKYIRQMTNHLQESLKLSDDDKDLVDFVFCAAQSYMKTEMKDECRYVSLRDIERCMQFFEFFHNHSSFLEPKIETQLTEGTDYKPPGITSTIRWLIQTVGVCYHVSLQEREKFRKHLTRCLKKRHIFMTERDMEMELIACQETFLGSLKMDTDIAPNEALRENVYLITICSELRIPLFLVGKPGSSKSLARSIVAGNMQGNVSKIALYKRLKKVEMITYQCSALTDAKGVESIFKQCAEVQKSENLKTFAAVAVLDEIGLAEDSSNMPLKILHPLLECGSTISGTLAQTHAHEKVGFVGISNWALDPAKMNRGIFVTRSTPSKDDLLDTAKAIIKKDAFRILDDEIEVLRKLTDVYLQIYNNQLQTVSKEYFGLRDYYSLIKMVNANSLNKERCECRDIAHAAQRNFSGGEEGHFDTFMKAVADQYPGETPEKATVEDMIRKNLTERDTRFLMLLTEQHASVGLLEHIIKDFHQKAQVIYGSRFPGDHNFTEICRNINCIKVCMETGGNVVLLGMAEIHESLYDALNQHYTKYGGQRYVDIGLGGNRVNCRIADNFRLIIVEQKDVVYFEYPIPLVNRLEKHHLKSTSLLTARQKTLGEDLSHWAKAFSKSTNGPFVEKDAFIGYHTDTASSLVLSQRKDQTLENCKRLLLQTATVDAMFRAYSSLVDGERCFSTYTKEQMHDNLMNLLEHKTRCAKGKLCVMEIASFSNILTEKDRKKIEKSLGLQKKKIMLLSLQQFDTQQEYLLKLDTFFLDSKKLSDDDVKVLLIQCPQAHKHGPLLACAKYCVTNRLRDVRAEKGEGTVIVAFLLSAQRRHGDDVDIKHQLRLEHGASSEIAYVDDLRPAGTVNTVVSRFYEKSLTEILRIGKREFESSTGIPESTVNFVGMLRDSICQAMAKVKRNNGTDNRNLRCIQLLSKLLSQAEGVNREFQLILGERMIEIYSERDNDGGNEVSSWITKEAKSAKNLQEGGTFGKTLCLCLKRHLADLLAFIISTVDENNNLEFLLSEKNSPWKQELWVTFFKSCKLEWSVMKRLREFPVKILPNLTGNFSPSFPYSYVLNGIFETQWDTIKDKEEFAKRKMFFRQFQEMPEAGIVRAICNKDHKEEVLSSYAADVIHYHNDFSQTGEVGQQCLTKVLLAITEMEVKELEQIGVFQEGDDLTAVHYVYKQHSKHLLMLHKILKVCPDLLAQADEWIEKQRGHKELIIHTMAMKSMLESIAARHISDEKTCIEWMNITNECKAIFHSCKDLVQHQVHKEEISLKWKPISLLDLLLLQLLPNAGSDSFTNYVEVVVSHAKKLLKPLNTMGFQNKDFLRIVLNVLRRSYEDIRLRLLFGWENPTCGMCRKVPVTTVQLPCGHFICDGCSDKIQAAAEMQRQCPKCQTHIPNEFATIPAKLSDKQEKEAEEFKANCTSFFLHYLTQFCFSAIDPTMEELALLFLYELVAGISKNGGKMELETLAIDLNIATRSYIFKGLLRHYGSVEPNEVSRLLSRDDISREKLEELVVVILHGLETDLHDKQPWETIQRTWRFLKEHTGDIALETLNSVALVRHALLQNLTGIRVGQSELDLTQLGIVQMCQMDKTDVLSKFLVTAGCQQFGTDWFTFISKHKVLKTLVPEFLVNTVNEAAVDYWLILGEKYRDIGKDLHKISYEAYKRELESWIPEAIRDQLPVVLAIAWHGQPEHIKELKIQLRERRSPLHWNFKWLDKKIPNVSEKQSSLLKQLIVLIECILICRPHLMNNYLDLARSPVRVSKMFWPGMPESLYFSLRDILAAETIAAYVCPNGHPYVIGECTRPVVEAECPECGEIIGGRSHEAAVGNQRIEQSAASQTGYQLFNDVRGKDDPSDRMSKQGVAVTHFITHSCMLIGLQKDHDAVSGMLKRNYNREKDSEYLLEKLQDNINELSQALGRNYDDAVIVMFRCIVSLFENGFEESRVGENAGMVSKENGETNWGTMTSRREWERRFRSRYLLPVFKNLDQVLIEAQNRINAVEKLQDMLLYRTAHEIEIGEEEKEMSWHHPMLWKAIKHSNAAHLLQTVRDSHTRGRALNVILESPDLHLLQYLENVLELQRALIQKYQNQKDMKQVDEITFDMYMDDGDGHRNRKLIQKYIHLWNSIYEVFRVEANQQVKQYLKEISVESPISMALPSSRGRGRCAKMLAEYLIDIHNNFLRKCWVAMKFDMGPEVDVQQLLKANFICIDKEKVLLPLISMHTNYTTTVDESGRHHHIRYNIEALEKQVRENYVLYKPSIDKKSLPCITYPQDVGIGSNWDRIRENIDQVPLSHKIVQELDGLVSNQDVTPADVCDAVRTLTHATSFLAKIKGDATKSLHTYLQDVLLLSRNHMMMIPRSALVCHTLALYLRLMWHKAVNFVEQGLDPYQEALCYVDQEEIEDPNLLRELKDAFDHMDIAFFQQRLNEVMVQAPDFSPTWSLKDEIFPNMEFLEGDDEAWFERIPSEIRFKHISHLFQLAVKGVATSNGAPHKIHHANV